MDATSLAEKIRRKELSPVEVVNAFLDRIDRLNPILNAFCITVSERAQDEARRAEDAVMSGAPVGVLHGVPIAFKDLTVTEGIETTFGSLVFKGNIPPADAIVVERAKRAGAILLGKTQTSELGHSGHARNFLFGATHNPWNLERSPGGSSGGSAAAVAAAMIPFAEGSDGAGSVRIPASCCGIYALKPHFGRIPSLILENYFETLLTQGPMTWSVRDAALLLSVWAGPDTRDPLSLPRTDEDFLSTNDRDFDGARVAYTADFGLPTEPEIRDIVGSAARRLEALGCEVEEIQFRDGRDALDTAYTLWYGLMAPHGRHLPEHRQHMARRVVEQIENGLALSAIRYQEAQIARSVYYRYISQLFKEYDFIVGPTLCTFPPSIHSFSFGPDEINGEQVDPQMGWFTTYLFNLTLHPAASIPAGFSSDGLPVGMQIVGRRFAEADVLQLSARIEEASPWPRPPTAS